MQANKSETITPRWLTLEGAATYSGLTSRTIQNYIAAGHVRSSNVIAAGKTRGRRLVDRLSLDSFLEQGVSLPPAEIVMNTSGQRNNGGRKPKGTR